METNESTGERASKKSEMKIWRRERRRNKSKRNLHLAPFCALFSHAVSTLLSALRLFGKSAGKPTLLFNKQNVLRHYNPKGMRRRQKNANCTAQETIVGGGFALTTAQQHPSLAKSLNYAHNRGRERNRHFAVKQQRTALRENKCERRK